MKCLACGGRMEPRTVDISEALEVKGKSRHYIVTDVPAEVCHQCGETVYTFDVAEKLAAVTKKVRKGAPPPKTVAVPVYSLQDDEG